MPISKWSAEWSLRYAQSSKKAQKVEWKTQSKISCHLFESSGTLIAACLSFCRLEEMKFILSLILCAQAWDTRSDDVSDLSISRPVSDFQFWNSSYLETLARFCMEMLKFSKFDLEQTTTKSTINIIVYISLDFLRWQTLPFAAIEQTPHRIVVFW